MTSPADLAAKAKQLANRLMGYEHGTNKRSSVVLCELIDALAATREPTIPEGPPVATEKDINRWQAEIQERPEGPWVLGNGGSFDRTTIKPISDEMLAELAHWLHMGYTPWNGRSMPLSSRDRQFMYLLYFSVQGLVSRMRAAEKAALPASQTDYPNETRDLIRAAIMEDEIGRPPKSGTEVAAMSAGAEGEQHG
jgi:hypothetical protein